MNAHDTKSRPTEAPAKAGCCGPDAEHDHAAEQHPQTTGSTEGTRGAAAPAKTEDAARKPRAQGSGCCCS